MTGLVIASSTSSGVMRTVDLVRIEPEGLDKLMLSRPAADASEGPDVADHPTGREGS